VPGASYNPTYEDHQVKFLLPGTQFTDNSNLRTDMCCIYACSGLLPSVSCWQNLPPEKDLIDDLILCGDDSLKDNKCFLGYTKSCTIIQYLNHVELPKITK